MAGMQSRALGLGSAHQTPIPSLFVVFQLSSLCKGKLGGMPRLGQNVGEGGGAGAAALPGTNQVGEEVGAVAMARRR